MESTKIAQFAYDLAIVVGTETGAANIPLLLGVRGGAPGRGEATLGFLATQDLYAAVKALEGYGLEVTDFSVLALEHDVESVIIVSGNLG